MQLNQIYRSLLFFVMVGCAPSVWADSGKIPLAVSACLSMDADSGNLTAKSQQAFSNFLDYLQKVEFHVSSIEVASLHEIAEAKVPILRFKNNLIKNLLDQTKIKANFDQIRFVNISGASYTLPRACDVRIAIHFKEYSVCSEWCADWRARKSGYSKPIFVYGFEKIEMRQCVAVDEYPCSYVNCKEQGCEYGRSNEAEN